MQSNGNRVHGNAAYMGLGARLDELPAKEQFGIKRGRPVPIYVEVVHIIQQSDIGVRGDMRPFWEEWLEDDDNYLHSTFHTGGNRSVLYGDGSVQVGICKFVDGDWLHPFKPEAD
jgi:prepilin-type processing-associated H-X9-DG protein